MNNVDFITEEVTVGVGNQLSKLFVHKESSITANHYQTIGKTVKYNEEKFYIRC